MKNLLRNLMVLLTIALTFQTGLGNYITPTTFAAAGPVLSVTGGSASFVAGNNSSSTPVAVDSGITVTADSSTTLASATVAITGNFHSSEDVLSFINDGLTMGNITASYNTSTGVLTLTSADATLAQWQAALRSITYTDTALRPNTATRTVSFTVTDDVNTSSTATRTVTVTVTDADQTPIVTTNGGSTAYTAGTTGVTLDAGVTISDLNNGTLASARVSIGSGFQSGDVLAYTNDEATMGNITASYDAFTGVLTLISSDATATLAQWQSALRGITFLSTSTTPGQRIISYAVSDGTKTSAAATHTVEVTVMMPPSLTTSSGSASFVAGDNAASTPVAIDPGITVSADSSTTLASATVAITGNFHAGEDVLSFINDGLTMGNITASYNAVSGVLTMTSAGAIATLAQWQAALRSITYTDTAITPSTATRTISYSVTDRVNASNTATRTVTVTATDQTPIVTTNGGSTNYISVNGTASTPVAMDNGLTISDLDNTTLSSATVSITSHFDAGKDILAYTNDGAPMGNITASYDAFTGVLTLTSSGATATLAQWQRALRGITFSSTSATPGQRIISYAVSDGTKTSAAAAHTVEVTVIMPPSLTTSSGSTSFFAGDNKISTPVAIDSGITVTADSSTTLESATVAITGNFHSSEDVLSFINDGLTMGNITASYNTSTGVLTLTSADATATLAQWQNALHAVTYNNTAVTPITTTRTISFTVSDGTNNSSIATKSITLHALSSLKANSNTLSVPTGQTASVGITAIFSNQAHIDVTSSVTWTVRNPAIANVTSGRVTGKTPGSTVVSAVYGTQSVDINVTVTGTPVSGSESSPSSSTNTGSSTTNTSTSINTNTPAQSGPSTPPTQETKTFYDLVEPDRLAAYIQDALAGNSVTFQDAASHWASKDILSAAKIGIINGYPDGRFRPDASITRAEFSTILVKAFALRSGSGTIELRDIRTSWARESIEILASNGVINGYSDGTFHADQRITRAEMVAMISKILIFQNIQSGDAATFVDVVPQHWAKEIIELAAKAGIIEGKGENRFEPDANLTRAEALTVIMRMLRENPTINKLLG
ncbi:S-layer homology domain-containing protein [Paenibacillus pabuli]|uniref:S-layer homology domain-containing protein n=1 Tax=Paenibacillus pabuli TaxID=1472 RepID=UPI001FFEB31B|nr:S-layer homology domain-containing protein [Paenibacillus pabuli]UPK45451.1 S-layer homology domain-containing protein [Paenibacillus pabuli]